MIVLREDGGVTDFGDMDPTALHRNDVRTLRNTRDPGVVLALEVGDEPEAEATDRAAVPASTAVAT